ncbi:secreted protein [Candidatus Magnetobacterium bavaricum]|uniref:Secreted protein n=1 Tax=Candidatus Magnetobacterium bavaricum TaxID=29290 RepID=A0A0F3GKT4_9BACT|nr:secreted protein [Candidatus Magnetobacterium bavaricum]
MNRKLLIINLAIVVIFVFVLSTILLAGDIVIFSAKQKDKKVKIAYSKCNLPGSTQFLRVGRSSGINWKWENKIDDWCGWGIQDIPEKNIQPYLKNGFLVIKYKGQYDRRSPEVAFRDMSNRQTALIKFEGNFTDGEATQDKDATVKISLEKFFGTDPDFYPADPTKIFELKFDAEYSSVRGKLYIHYIAITTDDKPDKAPK